MSCLSKIQWWMLDCTWKTMMPTATELSSGHSRNLVDTRCGGVSKLTPLDLGRSMLIRLLRALHGPK